MDLKIKYVLLRFAPHIFFDEKEKNKKESKLPGGHGKLSSFFHKKIQSCR